MGDVYHTPQYKIEALSSSGQLHKNTQQARSEYLYEDTNGPSSLPSHSYRGKDDAYVLPPQDRGHTPEIRLRNAEKRNIEDIYDDGHYTLARNSGFDKDFSRKGDNGNVEDMYDEGHYSLARNSGFGKDFSKPEKGDSKVLKEIGTERKTLNNTHMIIIIIVFMMLAIGGILAYVLIDRIGKNCCILGNCFPIFGQYIFDSKYHPIAQNFLSNRR